MMEKIKNLIETSRSFAVLSDENPEDHEILAKEILLSVIGEKNLPVINLPQGREFSQTKWAAMAKQKNNTPLLQKASIRLPKGEYGIKEVGYNEDDGHYSFLITFSGKNFLKKDDLVLENLPPKVDSVFCLFEENSKLDNFSRELQLPEREKIVFITPNERALTEKIFDIAQIFNPNVLNDKDIVTLFFAALTKETNNFSERITAETLSLASLFLKNGAKKELVYGVLEKENTLPITQLTGRTLARTYLDNALNVSWSFINQRDIQKTGLTQASPAKFHEILKKIKTLIPPQKLHLLLWQDNKEGVKALATSPLNQNTYLLPLAQKMRTEINSHFFITGPFENFSKAEMSLRQAIREVVHNN